MLGGISPGLLQLGLGQRSAGLLFLNSLVGGLSFVGSLSKRAGKSFVGAVLPAGGLSAVLLGSTLFFKSLVGGLSFSGSLFGGLASLFKTDALSSSDGRRYWWWGRGLRKR